MPCLRWMTRLRTLLLLLSVSSVLAAANPVAAQPAPAA